MKKLLLLFLIPGFIYAQDAPLIEQKIATKSIENKEKEEQERLIRQQRKKSQSLALDHTMYNLGRSEAKLHYDCTNCGKIWTGLISTVNPLYGLVPAVSFSVSKPKNHNLNYPSFQKMKDADYNRGYRKQAHKMKAKRVWGGFFIGTAIYTTVLLIFILPST